MFQLFFRRKEPNSRASLPLCESCRSNTAEVLLPADTGLTGGIRDPGPEAIPFRLCRGCNKRLLNRTLRPLELFNLLALHGHEGHLHDDFYDYDTGMALNAELIKDAERFPFPELDDVRDELPRLVDFAIVQYFPEDDVEAELRRFDSAAILPLLQAKLDYNPGIVHLLLRIAAKALRNAAADWVRELWTGDPEALMVFAEALAACLPIDEAFSIITSTIENGDDRFLNRNVSAMLFLKDERTLDWIESIRARIGGVSDEWGQLAASSQFSWKRAEIWLEAGRPLSLIALDALYHCTDASQRLNQSLWLRELAPKLSDRPLGVPWEAASLSV